MGNTRMNNDLKREMSKSRSQYRMREEGKITVKMSKKIVNVNNYLKIPVIHVNQGIHKQL